MRIGATGRTETGTERTTETGAVGTAETGVMSVAGGTVVGIPTSTATPGPSKVFANRKMSIQIKGDRSKMETQIHTCKEEIKKKREE